MRVVSCLFLYTNDKLQHKLKFYIELSLFVCVCGHGREFFLLCSDTKNHSGLMSKGQSFFFFFLSHFKSNVIEWYLYLFQVSFVCIFFSFYNLECFLLHFITFYSQEVISFNWLNCKAEYHNYITTDIIKNTYNWITTTKNSFDCIFLCSLFIEEINSKYLILKGEVG